SPGWATQGRDPSRSRPFFVGRVGPLVAPSPRGILRRSAPPARRFLRGAGMSEWVLAEQTHAFVRAQKWQVAVLPFGATEPHNLHMPYGTDPFQVDVIGSRACQYAYEAGARVVLLPAVPFGVNTNYFKVPGALACSLAPTTLLRILTDIADSM